jgi:hypothetical protein
MSVFPGNFDLLAGGEEKIRQLSKAAIEASEDLSLHARMIERAMNMLDYVAKRRVHADEDELVLQMLAARLFNSGAWNPTHSPSLRSGERPSGVLAS